MIRLFFRINSWFSLRIHRLLPWRLTRSLFRLHETILAELMRRKPEQVVLDLGGGRHCHFSEFREPSSGTVIVALDILLSALRENTTVDHRVVSDLARSIPIKSGSVDIVTTRSVIEHLESTARFTRECYRVLRPGGHCVHVMPGRHAPFALLNRLLTHRTSMALLNLVYPQFRGSWGFPAYYNDCWYPRIVQLLQDQGFLIEQIHLRYYQSTYYRAFLPAYLLSLAYDILLWALQLRPLSSQILVVARRPEPPQGRGSVDDPGSVAQR